MKHFVLLLVLIGFVVAAHPHARADETGSGAAPGALAIPPDAIVPSEPVGYLGGASEVTPAGDFTWRLPVWVPPGRMQPDLALTYSARGDNELLGVGFSLSGLSEIHRCGQTMAVDGQVTGVDFSKSDRFCLDGQRLILISGTYGESGSEYRLERDGFDKIVYHEGGWLYPGSFEVWTKDGRIVRYEGLKSGRAKPSPNPPYALSAFEYADVLWVLSEVKDRAGNAIRYHYATLHDQPNDFFTFEYLPERIEYTVGSSNPTGKREVRFVYEDRWDPSFTFLSGVRLRTTKRLKAIELYAPNPDAKGLVGRYELAYRRSVSNGRSLLDRIARCDGEGVCLGFGTRFAWEDSARPEFDTIDMGFTEFPDPIFVFQSDTGFIVLDADGDGKDEILYRIGPDYFIRRMNSDGIPLGELIWLDPALTANPWGVGFTDISMSQTRPVDIDGDGALEVWAAQVPEHGYHIFQWDSALAQLVSTDLVWPSDALSDGSNIYLEAVHFGDLDGDGLLDLLHQDYVGPTEPYWNIHRNAGGWELDPAILSPVEAYCGKSAKVLDVSGDGRAEIWNGANFTCTETITVGLRTDGQVHVEDQQGLGFGAKQALWADLNGDGLRDIVKPASPAGWVRWATGTGFGPEEDLIDGPLPEPSAGDGMDPGNHVADINGDGLEDILVFRLSPSPNITAYLSKGDGSFHPKVLDTWPGTFHAFEGFSTSRPGDFNGDGLLDIVQVGPDGHLRVLVQTPGQVDVVHEIWDDVIAEHPREVIQYSNQWSDSPKPATCEHPQRCIKHGMPVVREHWVWQGAEVGQYRKLAYSYEDPRIDLWGRGFLGFGEVRVRDVDRLSETWLTFDHVTRSGGIYPNAGLPKSVTHIAPILAFMPSTGPVTVNARVSKVVNDYTLKPLNQGKTHFIYLSGWTSDEWEQDATLTEDGIELPSAPAGSVLRHREGTYEYDEYGNQTLAEGLTQGGVHQRAVRTYDIRPDDWLISLTDTLTLTSTKGGGAVVPEPRFTKYVHDARGFLESVEVEPTSLDPNEQLTTTFARDGDGLVYQITWEAPGELPRYAYFAYEDDERLFPSEAWNDLGFTESFAYHPAYGVLVLSKDLNGVETRRQYDGFGRLRHIKTDGEAGIDLWHSLYVQDDWARGLVAHSWSETGEEGYVVLDELGRTVEEASRAFDGQWARSSVSYDLFGRVAAATRPELGAISANKTTSLYDTLDRPLYIEAPDGAATSYQHSFFEVRVWDASKNESVIAYDADGRTVKSADVLNGVEIPTTYAYGDFDQITSITDAESNVTVLGYDRRGRRIALDDPDRGLTETKYNGLGELIWEKNALNQETTYQHDILGRLEERQDADGITTYIWDEEPGGAGAPGKLAIATAPDETITRFFYDELARPTSTEWMIDGHAYAVDTFYDDFSRINHIEYPEVPNRPSRFAIEHAYNAHGFLEEVRDRVSGKAFWVVQGRNAEGALTQATAGNGALHVRGYDPLTGRLEFLQISTGVPLDKLEFKYHPNGNLKERIDSVTGRVETFAYDALDRLKLWTLTTDAGARETIYTYDHLGNMTNVLVNGVITEGNGYGQKGKPHALATTLHGAYDHDDVGRVTLGGGRAFEYTVFDLPKSVTRAGKTTQFGYDAFQRRVRKSSDASSTIYVAELYERRERSGSIEHVFYIPGEQGPIAEVHFDEATAKEKTLYLHGDSLGSTRVVVPDDGSKPERMYFEPFGQRIEHDGSPVAPNFSPPVEVGFTGHHHDDDLGLINTRGRMYSPEIRRFLTPDPVVALPLFGQSYNRYAYALHNPTRFVDPTGFTAEESKGSGCAEKGCATVFKFDLNAGAVKKSQVKRAGPPKGSTPRPTQSKSDSSGFNASTGAAAPASQASGSTPAPAAEPPSAPAEPTSPVPGGTAGGSEAESWRDSSVVQFLGGFAAGVALGAVPTGSLSAGMLSAVGVLNRGTDAAELGKSVGEIVGGGALMFFGGGGTVAGVGLNATGFGAALGVPAIAASTALVAAGAANAAAGIHGLTQALSTGSGGGAGSPSGPVHHIATNKNWDSSVRGGPWSPKFQDLFKKAGMTLEDAANKVLIPRHRGPHPEAYHQAIFDRLSDATHGLSGDAYKQAFRAELDAIRVEAATAGSLLNKLLTGQ